MDWSLVLASQGIEAIINQSDEGWELIVEPEEFDRAKAVLRQYQIENRGWHWSDPFPGAGIALQWSILWVAAIVGIYYWTTVVSPAAKEAGVLDSVRVAKGEWWRLFTAVTLHENIPHLASNAVTGFILMGLVMARYGPGIGVLAAFLAGVAGNAADFFIYTEPHESLGASGMVTGALGLITSQSFAFWRKFRLGRRFFLQSAAGGILILVLIGFDPGADVVAHVGGFIAGMIIGVGLGHVRPAALQSRALNVASATVLAAIIIVTWRLALGATLTAKPVPPIKAECGPSAKSGRRVLMNNPADYSWL